MDLRLTDAQQDAKERAKRFAAEHIVPVAGDIDRQRVMSAELLGTLRSNGWLSAALPAEWGAGNMDALAYGVVTEEIGKACSSVRSFMTAHNMAAHALVRFGTPEQKARWLPDICSGRKIIAFALTEEEVGSAGNSIATDAQDQRSHYRVNGTKVWITAGLVADLFLIFAQDGGRPIALVVERGHPGFTTEPMMEVLGVRGAMLARLCFEDVEIPMSQRIGPVGAGIAFVANAALDQGRFSIAWGAAGVVWACLDACLSYAVHRKQAGHSLAEFQLVRRQLTDMLLAHTTARALCCRSAFFRMEGDPRAVMETTLAKYHAAQAAVRVANDAVRLHGANGYSIGYSVERYLRDATVLEIIEGTREIHQVGLASYALQSPHVDF
ncbi:acyl-CoA dehydrogenase family protein [Solilutibacter silvestris]|uniref:Acyl-CoA dehydrogenase n=1 Tax=Solilutibacter silvestris TaxID=1645665 RepID=A0A2K1Q003_9GAMM|nr:acyl-CoA dehydrogenase family protein [Lysobacter silvestris]PNS08376.1 Acyl-CoA dehydrogenase [Lysobacter silvestris]